MRPIEDRFWEKVSKSDGCWLWTASVDGGGYGQLAKKRNGSMFKAHRLSWELHNGPIPTGLSVLHRCDVPACVNPAHLFVGTQKENVADSIRKRRFILGERGGGAKLTEDNVREIRRLAADGVIHRVIADKFGVKRGAVNKIVLGYRWRHIA